jgi:hypothetical protein
MIKLLKTQVDFKLAYQLLKAAIQIYLFKFTLKAPHAIFSSTAHMPAV